MFMSQAQSQTLGRMDRIGTIASVACLVHCVATPLLLSLFAAAAPFLPDEGRFHRLLALPVCLIALFAMGNGFRRHRVLQPALFMLSGLGLILAGAFYGERLPSHWMEAAVTMLGSALLVAAHRLNHRCCQDCVCHG